MLIKEMIRSVLAYLLITVTIVRAADYPAPAEGDYTIRDFKFTNGETLGMAAFIAAIIGGFNQVRGAILGGVILGVLDNLSAAYISSQYRGAFPLIVLIAVILLRPQGLLGRIEERTV